MTFNSDISWLPTSLLKNIDVPKIVYEPYQEQPYGGYYVSTTKTLVVVESDSMAPVIAHEFMHYLQDTRVGNSPGGGGLELFQKYSYNEAIRQYFRSMWWEMEALLFQERVAKSAIGTFWLQGLVLPRILDKELEM